MQRRFKSVASASQVAHALNTCMSRCCDLCDQRVTSSGRPARKLDIRPRTPGLKAACFPYLISRRFAGKRTAKLMMA
jgi:hypothetical protein